MCLWTSTDGGGEGGDTGDDIGEENGVSVDLNRWWGGGGGRDTGWHYIGEENGFSVDLSRWWGGGIQEMTLERRMVCLSLIETCRHKHVRARADSAEKSY